MGFATGAAIADTERWRRLIDDDETGGELAAALAALGKGRALDIAAARYKKVPKPYPEDHRRADLLRIKGGIQARWSEQVPASITGPRFVAHCAKRLDACGDVHRWLVSNL